MVQQSLVNEPFSDSYVASALAGSTVDPSAMMTHGELKYLQIHRTASIGGPHVCHSRMFAAAVSRERNAERRVVALGRRNQTPLAGAPPFKLRVEARGAFYFRTQCSGSADNESSRQAYIGGENNNGMNIRSGLPMHARQNEKTIFFFGTSDTLYNYYVQAVCFGCGHQEENKWIRRSPGFWALRLH
jgi:hypothetical protein